MRSASRSAVAVTLLLVAGCSHAARRTPEPVGNLLPLEFTRVIGPEAGGAVLDAGPAGTWSAARVGLPTVIAEGSRLLMWYDGSPAPGPGESPYLYKASIGFATSRDGKRWSLENDGRPVLEHGAPGSFDALAVSHPFVLKVKDEYWMWYAGADGTEGPNSVRVERIGLAKSRDGIHWTRANDGRPVVDIGGAGSIDSIQAAGPCVVEANGHFLMWYGAYNGAHKISFATSDDGVRWTKPLGNAPVEGISATGEQLGPSVYWDGARFLMLYDGKLDNEWVMYAAVSDDGRSWTRLSDDRHPLLPSPGGAAFDAGGAGRNRSVHASQLIVRDGRALMWYVGEDTRDRQRIGLAASPVR